MDNNLLIIGAGSHGHVVKETAEAMIKFDRIDFLDDNSQIAIGHFDEYKNLLKQYNYAFIALGNNELRSMWQRKLIKAGYSIPVLIHPTAFISPSAQIGEGSVVLPKSVVNTNAKVKEGVIIGIGVMADHDVTIGEYCHLNSGTIVNARTVIKPYSKINYNSIEPLKQNI